MSIEQSDFEAITAEDIQVLVDAQVAESLRLEFKLTTYGKSDSDKHELLKDASSFANSHGGHIVIGVRESGGIAVNVEGVGGDTDAEILRMEQILRNGIEPPIPGIRIRAIPLESGRKSLLLRIPKSWNPPHRVAAKGANRFYLRHSAGVHEPSLEELRALFSQSSTSLEHARRFRDERIALVVSQQSVRPLEGNGRLFLHIIPVAAFSGMVQLDVEKIHASAYVFGPISVSDMTPRFNFYGIVNERTGGKNRGYTQIFRNGALEATKACVLDRNREGIDYVNGLTLETAIFQRLSNYVLGLRDLGVPPPLIVMFTLEGVDGAHYAGTTKPWDDNEPPLEEHLIVLPECWLEDYGTKGEIERAVRPAFDALWNAVGYSRAPFFDKNGAWVGQQTG